MDQSASLTREEAEERAALLVVDRYEVALDFTGLLDGDTLFATSTIRFRCHVPGAATFVDSVGSIDEATLNGRRLDPASASAGRLPLRDLEEDNLLVIRSSQDDTGSSTGILRTVDPTDDLVYVWTSFEPDDARRAFACFDQPDLKAVFVFTVTAPASWTALSNTAPDSVTPEGDTRVWRFAPTPRLSTYVVVVNVGPFHEIRRSHAGHDLGLYCRQSLVPQLERDADFIFGLISAGLTWFGEHFGAPFPQERYDHVFVPNMGGAMENWGCVTCGDSILTRTEATYAQREQTAEFLLHEMAHMWFGDLVTMRWWDDLWLNEAFASWASVWAMTGCTEFVDAWASYLMIPKQLAYRTDLTAGTHPIRADAPDVASATANFDTITYYKGMGVLRQLAAYVGEPVFLAGLAEYFREHAWGNTRLDDLMDAVGAPAGLDLAEWTRGWLDHAGTDTLRLADGQVTVTSPDADPPRTHRLAIASYDDRGGLLATTEVTAGAAPAIVALPDASAHLLNAGDLTYGSFRTDPASQAWLVANAGLLPDPLARAVAVTTSWDLLLRGEVTGHAFLECALSALRTERSAAVVEPLLYLIRNTVELWLPVELIDAAQAQTAEVLEPLVQDPVHRVAALRALAVTGSTASQLALLDSAGEGDVDLAWRALMRRAELGDYDPAAVAATEGRDPDPEAWVSALMVRAACPELAAKQEVWQAVMVDRRVPVTENFGDLVRAFWRPQQHALLASFVDHYLDEARTLEGNAIYVAPLLRGMYPGAVAGPDFLARARVLADDPDVVPIVRQGLLDLNDTLERQLRARA